MKRSVASVAGQGSLDCRVKNKTPEERWVWSEKRAWHLIFFRRASAASYKNPPLHNPRSAPGSAVLGVDMDAINFYPRSTPFHSVVTFSLQHSPPKVMTDDTKGLVQ